MSDRTVTITLQAKDGMSRTFQQVARSGESMGKSLQRAADQAERELRDLGETSQRTGRSLDDMKGDVLNLGLGIGVMVGMMAKAGQSFRDQEVALGTLQRTYGDATEEMQAFAEQIQDTTNFSNDAAIGSANIAATLARNYAFTAQEIQQVLQISADLAAATGYELADATQRVVAALRGEAESAEMLGLTMNQAAIDSQNLTLTMSNQEAGHFRLNALIDQSAFALGRAAEQADTTYGAMVDLRDGVQDATQSVGDFIGPFGEIGAFAADNALQIGVMGLAIGQMGRGVLAANRLLGDFAARSATVARLTTALGPVGLAGAFGVAGFAALSMMRDIETTEEVIDSITEATQTYYEVLRDLAGQDLITGRNQVLAAQLMGINELLQDRGDLLEEEIDTVQQAQGFFNQWADNMGMVDQTIVGGLEEQITLWRDLTGNHELYNQVVKDGMLSMNEARLIAEDLVFIQNNLTDGAGAWADAADEVDSIMSSITEAGAEAQQQLIGALSELLRTGDFEGFEQDVTGINNAMIEQEAIVATATAGWVNFGDAMVQIPPAVDEITASHEAMAAAFEEAAAAYFQLGRGHRDIANAAAEYLQVADELRATERNAAQDRDTAVQSLLAEVGAYDDLTDAISRTLTLRSEMAGAGERMPDDVLSGLVDQAEAEAEAIRDGTAAMKEQIELYQELEAGIANTTTALDNGFRAIVSNTDAWASQADSVATWAEELIAAEGTYSIIDDLISTGRINQTEYNAAQEAYNDIIREQGEIQENVQTIQAKQAPLLAELLAQQENYTQAIADMPPELALVELGFMDSALSAQAMQLQMFALSGATGEAMDNIIGGAARADPVLRAMLEQMGLIEVGADGTVTVTVDGEGGIASLTSAIEDLTAVQWVALVGADATEAQLAILDAHGALDEWDAAFGAADVNVNDNASGTISYVNGLLNDLNNRTAVTYIDTVYRVFGAATGFPMGGNQQHGGMLDGAQMGRLMSQPTWVGEAGPELLLGGNHVLPHTASTRTSSGSNGDIHIHIENLYGDETLAERVSIPIVAAIQRAAQQHRAGFGL